MPQGQACEYRSTQADFQMLICEMLEYVLLTGLHAHLQTVVTKHDRHAKLAFDELSLMVCCHPACASHGSAGSEPLDLTSPANHRLQHITADVSAQDAGHITTMATCMGCG